MAVDTNPSSPTYGMDLSTGQYVPTNSEGLFYQGPMDQYVPPPPMPDPGPYYSANTAQVDTNPYSVNYSTYTSGPNAGAPAPRDAFGGMYPATSGIVGGDGHTYSPTAYAQAYPPLPQVGTTNAGLAEGRPQTDIGTPSTHITPPHVGSAGLASMVGGIGPGGRSFDEITGTDYLSYEERIWYLNQMGKTVDANGNVVPFSGGGTSTPAPTGGGAVGPNGRTFAQITGTEYLSPEERAWYLAQVGKSVTSGGAVVGGNTGSGRANWSHWGEGPGGSMLGFGALGHPTAGRPYAGQTAFPPQIEQWRSLVAKYFRPEDVNKALYVMSIENPSGVPGQTQIGGSLETHPGVGLFQIEHGGRWPGRPSAQELMNPETNVAFAASLLYG